MVCELYLNLKHIHMVWSRVLADRRAAGWSLHFGQRLGSLILVCVQTPYRGHRGYNVTQPWHVTEAPPTCSAH